MFPHIIRRATNFPACNHFLPVIQHPAPVQEAKITDFGGERFDSVSILVPIPY
jgi:hypothetical protein